MFRPVGQPYEAGDIGLKTKPAESPNDQRGNDKRGEHIADADGQYFPFAMLLLRPKP